MIKKILMGIGITIGAGLITAGISWNFLATANMSDKFVQQSDFVQFTNHNEKDHERINDKLDRIYETLMEFYRSIPVAEPSFGSTNDINNVYNRSDITVEDTIE